MVFIGVIGIWVSSVETVEASNTCVKYEQIILDRYVDMKNTRSVTKRARKTMPLLILTQAFDAKKCDGLGLMEKLMEIETEETSGRHK